MPTDPATVPLLTDADVEREFNATEDPDRLYVERLDAYPNGFGERMRTFAARIYALAASRVDTAEVERRAARKALAECAAWLGKGESQPVRFDEDGRFLLAFERVNAFSDRYLAREHPAPAPRECVPIKCAICRQDGADLSTGTHTTRDECIEALGASLLRGAP